MKENSKNKDEVEVDKFTTEYAELMKTIEKSVVVETQWLKKGDFFQKLSMYDNSYVLVATLGSTSSNKVQ